VPACCEKGSSTPTHRLAHRYTDTNQRCLERKMSPEAVRFQVIWFEDCHRGGARPGRVHRVLDLGNNRQAYWARLDHKAWCNSDEDLTIASAFAMLHSTMRRKLLPVTTRSRQAVYRLPRPRCQLRSQNACRAMLPFRSYGGRLTVDERYRGQKFGAALLWDAVIARQPCGDRCFRSSRRRQRRGRGGLLSASRIYWPDRRRPAMDAAAY
jgi:GNAT superfamily N-acetyltransferase